MNIYKIMIKIKASHDEDCPEKGYIREVDVKCPKDYYL